MITVYCVACNRLLEIGAVTCPCGEQFSARLIRTRPLDERADLKAAAQHAAAVLAVLKGGAR